VILLILSAAWLIAVALLIGRAVSQYSAYEKIPSMSLPPGCAPGAAIIVPARNEEQNIARCLDALSRQSYPQDQLSIIVINDGSTDQTEWVIRQCMQRDPRIKLIQGAPPPADWKGKPLACWLGAQAATNADWLCFVDADTIAEPAMLASAVTVAEDRHIDMLSLEPFQILGGFWDRLVISAGLFFAAFTQDLRRVNDSSKPDACANGQCILIRKTVYNAIGGHAAVRGEFAEDSALARLIKSNRYHLMVLGGDRLIRTRMYEDLPTLWTGIARVLVIMAGGPGRLMMFAAAAILLATATVVLPIITWFSVAAILASIASASLFGIHIGVARYYKIPFWYGLLFPIAYIIGAILAIDSLRRTSAGRMAWKGRVYSEPLLK
jgi:chlorobactene glucosyltransferase